MLIPLLLVDSLAQNEARPAKEFLSSSHGGRRALAHGLVGYRALAVDYTQDSGANKNNLDLILHGPVVGLSFRW